MAEENTEIDINGRGLWSQMTFDFISKNVNPTITFLDLSTNHINQDSANFIAQVLVDPNSQLRSLALVQTRMTLESSSTIFSAIGESQLLELVADDNIFNSIPLHALSESLKKNPPLALLSLNGCDIPSEGFVEIAAGLPYARQLLHLRLESNSGFQTGAEALARVIPESTLISLSIADNEIWEEGTIAILNAVSKCPNFVSLDISYNICPLDKLGAFLIKSPLQQLSISGCKVVENTVPHFLSKVLPHSHLSTLILDGLNYQYLPISWPRVRDILFTNPQYFSFLLDYIHNTPINDLRIGFLSLSSIFQLLQIHSEIDRPLTICMHDFGRTDNCWMISSTPTSFSLQAPDNTFQWNTDIAINEGVILAELIKLSTFNEKPIENLNLSKPPPPPNPPAIAPTNPPPTSATIKYLPTPVDPQVWVDFFQNIGPFTFKTLDLSGRIFSSEALNAFYEALDNLSITVLDIGEANCDDEISSQFLSFYSENLEKVPEKLTFGFTGYMDETSEHSVFDQLKVLIENDSGIKELKINGPITARDSIKLFEVLGNNSTLEVLILNSTLIDKYRSPDPDLNSEIQELFNQSIAVLYDSFVPQNNSKLKQFHFQLLSDVFLYNEANYGKWIEIQKKLEENATL